MVPDAVAEDSDSEDKVDIAAMRDDDVEVINEQA